VVSLLNDEKYRGMIEELHHNKHEEMKKKKIIEKIRTDYNF
jgi:hypothetical protein